MKAESKFGRVRSPRILAAVGAWLCLGISVVTADELPPPRLAPPRLPEAPLLILDKDGANDRRARDAKEDRKVAQPKKGAAYAPAAPLNVHPPVVLPIDLVTALKLVDSQSPTVGFAQARVEEALARLDQASVLFLPNLLAGSNYFRHDGVDQNRRAEVFTRSRSNVFLGGIAQLRVDVADGLFLPLVGRQLANAAAANASAVRNNVQLEAASAYLDLLEVYAALAINADTLARAEQMLSRAKAAEEAGLSKTRADANRAQTEVSLRRQERLDIQGRIGAVSARLGRILFLQENVDLKPAEPAVVPVVLVPSGLALDDLVMTGFRNRPELAANRAFVLAAEQRLRQARLQPLIPSVQLEYRGGEFAGARNGNPSSLQPQGELAAGAYWQLDNLGFGYHAQVRVRRAEVDQTQFRTMEMQAQVRAEILEATKLASARFDTLEDAQEAVRQALEMYRKLLETSFGMIGPRPQYDALEPLLAIQALNQARVKYLTEVIEFNRAQFRLYTALGQPASCALPNAAAQPLAVPVVPPPGAATPARKGEKAKE